VADPLCGYSARMLLIILCPFSLNLHLGKVVAICIHFTFLMLIMITILHMYFRSSYMTGKLLLKLESTKFIIANHSRETFPFLEEYRCARSRTTFYYILGCLIFMEDTPVKFRSFMEPLLQVHCYLYSYSLYIWPCPDRR
jgi:exportin-7